METYDPQAIEAKWQRVVGGRARLLRATTRSRAPTRGRKHSTCSRCSRTRPARCTWGTSSTTRWATCSRTSTGATARPCCARWAGTRSACRPRTPRSVRAVIRARSSSATSPAIRGQMRRLGWAIDWDREVSAHEPDYYRWTQWLFLRFFEEGLAYRKEAPVNWCPNDQTVRRERVRRRRALRALRTPVVEPRNLDAVVLQDHGVRRRSCSSDLRARSTGPSGRRRSSATGSAARRAPRSSSASRSWTPTSPVFTTRPDTLFGATFFVLAPEHPFVERAGETRRCGRTSRHAAARAGRGAPDERRRTASSPATTSTNPVNGEQIPIWVADYVLMDYGTGAIMAVPAHDERDREFAERYDLPVVPVIDEERTAGRLR